MGCARRYWSTAGREETDLCLLLSSSFGTYGAALCCPAPNIASPPIASGWNGSAQRNRVYPTNYKVKTPTFNGPLSQVETAVFDQAGSVAFVSGLGKPTVRTTPIRTTRRTYPSLGGIVKPGFSTPTLAEKEGDCIIRSLGEAGTRGASGWETAAGARASSRPGGGEQDDSRLLTRRESGAWPEIAPPSEMSSC